MVEIPCCTYVLCPRNVRVQYGIWKVLNACVEMSNCAIAMLVKPQLMKSAQSRRSLAIYSLSPVTNPPLNPPHPMGDRYLVLRRKRTNLRNSPLH